MEYKNELQIKLNLKNPIMLCEYDFVLIVGVGYGGVLQIVHSHKPCSRWGVIFAICKSFVFGILGILERV
jgi:spermidine synthase